MIQIRYDTLTLAEFQTIVRMDAAAYGADIFTHPGLAEERFGRCGDFFVTAYDGGKMVGGWSTYPVKDGLWDAVSQSPRMMDDDVAPDWICPPEKGAARDLMAFDMVIDPHYRGRGIARLLMEGYRASLREKIAAGYVFGRFYGYVITAAGYHMMMRYGAEIVKEVGEGALFAIDMARFLADGAVEGAIPPPPHTIQGQEVGT